MGNDVDSIRLSVSCSEKVKKYVQYTLEGLLGNRVGVGGVEYVENAPGTTYQILGELAKFSVLKDERNSPKSLTAK